MTTGRTPDGRFVAPDGAQGHSPRETTDAGDRDYRAELLILNAECERLGIGSLVSSEVAQITPPEELERVVVSTRHYLLDRARWLGEV